MPRTISRILAIACASFSAIAFSARADDTAKPSRHPIARSGSSPRTSDGSSAGSAAFVAVCVAGALAAFGAVAFLSKKGKGGPGLANLRVVGRASLSPKHSVYLLRVGDRTLILGTGGQGPPSLLGELAAGETIDLPAATRSMSGAIPRAHITPTIAGGVA